MPKRYMSPDRRQQVKTTKERHGDDFYKNIGSKSTGKGVTFRDPEKARAAAMKRWHGEEASGE